MILHSHQPQRFLLGLNVHNTAVAVKTPTNHAFCKLDHRTQGIAKSLDEADNSEQYNQTPTQAKVDLIIPEEPKGNRTPVCYWSGSSWVHARALVSTLVLVITTVPIHYPSQIRFPNPTHATIFTIKNNNLELLPLHTNPLDTHIAFPTFSPFPCYCI
jgi:hypothetical protein